MYGTTSARLMRLSSCDLCALRQVDMMGCMNRGGTPLRICESVQGHCRLCGWTAGVNST